MNLSLVCIRMCDGISVQILQLIKSSDNFRVCIGVFQCLNVFLQRSVSSPFSRNKVVVFPYG